MVGWRILASCFGLVLVASAAQAQAILLQEKNQAGSYFHVEMSMALKGKLIVQQGTAAPLEQEAAAHHDFVERVLKEGEQGLFGKTVRFYQSAKVDITVDKKKSEHALPGDKALIVAQHSKDGVLAFSPAGPLTRQDLDLLEHFDTLALPGLLPGKEVSPGATWKLTDAAAQMLCYFEGLTANELTGKLEHIKDKAAAFTISGEARGIFAGAAVKLKVKADGIFDVATGRITSLTWTQDDDREQGPASPKMSAQVTVKLMREEVQPVKELSNVAVAAVPEGAVPADKTALVYSDPKQRYQLTHDRAWMLVAQTNDHLVLRLLDRGDFVAQVSISCWPNAGAGKHAKDEEFKEAMTKIPGWAQTGINQAGEIPAKEKGYWIYRMTATGLLNGQNTVQYFYLVAGPNGEQVVLAFAMTPAQADKLGSRDEELVRSLVFPANGKSEATAAKVAP